MNTAYIILAWLQVNKLFPGLTLCLRIFIDNLWFQLGRPVYMKWSAYAVLCCILLVTYWPSWIENDFFAVWHA